MSPPLHVRELALSATDKETSHLVCAANRVEGCTLNHRFHITSQEGIIQRGEGGTGCG